MFPDHSNALLRLLLVGVGTYVWLVFILRVTGKRTLSKMNAFDLVVTVALGSTLSSALSSNSFSPAEAAEALALLTLLQFAVTWLSVRSKRFSKLVKATPVALFWQGRFDQRRLRSERVTEEELLAAVRSSGASSMTQVVAIILETDGSLSVIRGGAPDERSTLANVEGTQ